MVSIMKSHVETHPSLGLGDNVLLESSSVSGSEFVKDEKFIHLSVFQKQKNTQRNGVGFQRYSSRRNHKIY